jgi:hypothetical protein
MNVKPGARSSRRETRANLRGIRVIADLDERTGR